VAAVGGPSQAWLDGTLPQGADAGTPRPGGVLRVRVQSEPLGLNQLHDQLIDGVVARYLHGPVYETLAQIDRASHPRYDLAPLLATGWEESADHLTLTVKLRSGVRFHNGEPFSAADVVAVFDTVMNPKLPTQTRRSFFVDLEKYSAVDSLTVVFKWKRPHHFGVRALLASVPMMPRSALKGDFGTAPILRAPIGTGPFCFERWEPKKAITLRRFDEYWGAKPYLDAIEIRPVADATVATQLWEAGEFGVMTQISPLVWRSLEGVEKKNAWAQTGYERSAFLDNQYSFIAWNHLRPYFADARVRRAMAMLFPWDVVTKNVDLGLEKPTTCPYYPASESCDPSVAPLPFDPKRASELLDEAGWKERDADGVRKKGGVRFRFSFMANASSVRMGKILPLYQEQLKAAGIAMQIEPTETATYVSHLRAHDFDAAALSWATLDATSDNYQVFHSSQIDGGSNYVSYRDATVDRWLEQIRSEVDAGRRAALEREVHRKLYDEQVYLFLTRRPLLDAISKHVHGLKPSLSWYDLRYAWVDQGQAP
jgi:peptide/nickel transport system substrate-binding protein